MKQGLENSESITRVYNADTSNDSCGPQPTTVYGSRVERRLTKDSFKHDGGRIDASVANERGRSTARGSVDPGDTVGVEYAGYLITAGG